MDIENAALKAENAKLRRQASASRREVAVWRELALREKCCLTALPEELLQHIVNLIPFAGALAPPTSPPASESKTSVPPAPFTTRSPPPLRSTTDPRTGG